MSMSPEKFTRINGHTAGVALTPKGEFLNCICDCSGAEIVLSVQVRSTRERALEELVQRVLRAHVGIVIERADWKCENCRGVDGLDGHHKEKRSQERNDRIANLQALCCRCHRREHSAGAVFRPAEPCGTCNGKGFLNPDGSAVNAFEGNDSSPVIKCPQCTSRQADTVPTA